MTPQIEVQRYRDGGSVRISDGARFFILDQAFSKGPLYGKWLTDWPKRGGHVVEQGTVEYDLLVQMIRRANRQGSRIQSDYYKYQHLPLP